METDIKFKQTTPIKKSFDRKTEQIVYETALKAGKYLVALRYVEDELFVVALFAGKIVGDGRGYTDSIQVVPHIIEWFGFDY